MSAAGRAFRRRRARYGAYFVVPAAGDLTTWTATAAAASGLGNSEQRLVVAIAHLLRRAVIVDGARPGDRVWIDYAELGRVA